MHQVPVDAIVFSFKAALVIVERCSTHFYINPPQKFHTPLKEFKVPHQHIETRSTNFQVLHPIETTLSGTKHGTLMTSITELSLYSSSLDFFGFTTFGHLLIFYSKIRKQEA